MNCPKCKKEIPENFKFCPECGSNISAISGVEPDVSLGAMKTVIRESGDGMRDVSLGGMKTQAAGAGSGGNGFHGMALRTGELFAERYEILEELGRGGFAVVYKAKDKKLGRIVAIKKLYPEHDGMAAARFKREAQSIAALNHRNIVQVYDVGQDGEDIYLVMEYIDGGNLRDLLKKKGKFSLAEALPLFKGIAQGLSYAHRKNLVHRDIKPANILLSGEWQGASGEENSPDNRSLITDNVVPKLVDFGLAQAGRDSELSMSGYGMGTPYYMPPEQRRDAKSVNHTADIYALGKVLYEMVTGQIPDTLDPAEIPPPPELAQIVFKCTKPKPEDRFFSVDELLLQMDQIQTTKHTNHTKIGNRQSSIGNSNSCPACGAENGDDVKFCEACGAGLTRICPECGKENSVNKQFCGACGTDVAGFLTAQEALSRMEKYLSEQKWSRVVKEAEGVTAEVRLPGKKGAALRVAIATGAEKARQAIAEIERLEKQIEKFCRAGSETPPGDRDHGSRLQDEKRGGDTASTKKDEALLQTLSALSKLKPLPDGFLTLEKEAKARIAEANRIEAERAAELRRIEAERIAEEKRRIEEEKRIEAERIAEARRQAALAAKRRARNIGIGIAAALIAWIAMDQTVLAVRKSAFKKAVAHKQMVEAEAVAVKLGDRYNTAGDLELLRQALEEKKKYVAAIRDRGPELGPSAAEDLLKRFGGTDWTEVEKLVAQAEAPGDPAVAIANFPKAGKLVAQIRSRIDSLLKAEAEFSKGWKTGGDLLKQFEPATYAALTQGVEQVRTLSDPRQARDGWTRLAADLSSAQKKLGQLHTAKAAYEKAVANVGAELLKRYGPNDWASAQQAKAQAEKATSLSAAIALWEQATASVKKAESFVQTSLQIKTIPEGADISLVAEGRDLGPRSGIAATLEKGKSYTLTVSKKGYKTVSETLLADWTGLKEKTVVLEKWNGPEEGRKWTADLGSGVQMDFMPVAAGSFQMGSENGSSDEKPVHRVTLSQPFWLAKTEVTQAQYQQVMGSNPSNWKGSDLPVETVSWNDAVSFCEKMTARERQAGRLPEGFEYTLPTEAQWEYACRAGTTGDYAGNLDSMGWYSSNAGGKTHSVGTKQANAWGLYDMHGNVYEWCSDWYDSSAYNQGSVTDPRGASSGSDRVDRGGSWGSDASYCRSANRGNGSPDGTGIILGFRPLVQQK